METFAKLICFVLVPSAILFAAVEAILLVWSKS